VWVEGGGGSDCKERDSIGAEDVDEDRRAKLRANVAIFEEEGMAPLFGVARFCWAIDLERGKGG